MNRLNKTEFAVFISSMLPLFPKDLTHQIFLPYLFKFMISNFGPFDSNFYDLIVRQQVQQLQ